MRLPAIRRNVLLALLLALAAGCASGKAFGPSSDDRLESASTRPAIAPEKELLADLQALEEHRCAPAPGRFMEGTEVERLRKLTGAVSACADHQAAVEELIRKRPGLKFFNGADASGKEHDVPGLVAANNTAAADTRMALDKLVREIVALPVVEELEGKGRAAHTVPKARVDFTVLREAIGVLAPLDKDQLERELARAEDKLAAPEPPPATPPRRKR